MKQLIRNWAKALLIPIPLVGLARLPGFLQDLQRFSRLDRSAAPKLADTYPCLSDKTTHTPFDPHYFYQAAWLARELASNPPARHFDVGSSVNAMAILSGFVDTIFVDYRPLPVSLPGLACIGANIAALPFPTNGIGSLSCLHVIEHIGLGRYGDPIDPDGHRNAAAELSRVVAPGGSLFLSTPVGRERVCFNAHRVFAPASISVLFPAFDTVRFSYVDDAGHWRQDAVLADASGCDYACGMYTLRKRL